MVPSSRCFGESPKQWIANYGIKWLLIYLELVTFPQELCHHLNFIFYSHHSLQLSFWLRCWAARLHYIHSWVSSGLSCSHSFDFQQSKCLFYIFYITDEETILVKGEGGQVTRWTEQSMQMKQYHGREGLPECLLEFWLWSLSEQWLQHQKRAYTTQTIKLGFLKKHIGQWFMKLIILTWHCSYLDKFCSPHSSRLFLKGKNPSNLMGAGKENEHSIQLLHMLQEGENPSFLNM